MKYIQLFLLSMLLISGFAAAQEGSAEQQAWMEYMTPGEMHEYLGWHVGDWTSQNTMWLAPGMEPIKSEGKASFEMILGGRYLQGTFTGDFMGMPMEGRSLQAYDNALGVFKSLWIDNFGTGFMQATGKYDKETKTYNADGVYVDPMTKSEKNFRETFHHQDDDTIVMEMFSKNEDGSEFKNMEIVFTRVK